MSSSYSTPLRRTRRCDGSSTRLPCADDAPRKRRRSATPWRTGQLRLLDHLQLRTALLAALARAAAILCRCRPARRLRSEILLREHHALAGLACVDTQHGSNRNAHVMHDSRESRIELDVLISQLQPLGGARAEI